MSTQRLQIPARWDPWNSYSPEQLCIPNHNLALGDLPNSTLNLVVEGSPELQFRSITVMLLHIYMVVAARRPIEEQDPIMVDTESFPLQKILLNGRHAKL